MKDELLKVTRESLRETASKFFESTFVTYLIHGNIRPSETIKFIKES